MPTFRFSVDAAGKFQWPDGTWGYKNNDNVQFESPSPFVIQLIPESPGAPVSPFVSGQSQFRATKETEGSPWTVSQRVRNGINGPDKPLTEILFELNARTGTLARYRYAVAAESGGKCHLDASMVGEWGC